MTPISRLRIRFLGVILLMVSIWSNNNNLACAWCPMNPPTPCPQTRHGMLCPSPIITNNRIHHKKIFKYYMNALSNTSFSDTPRIQTDEKRLQSVMVLLLVSFLPLLGFTMCSPLIPTLGQHFSLNLGSASFGLLTSAYPLGMFFGVFFWSHLSDILGRKRTMLCSLLGSSLGLFMQAKAIASQWSISSFLLMRVLTGTFAGSNQIVKAYLADLGSTTTTTPSSSSPTSSLAQYLAWRDAACTMAYIIGPLSGGALFEALVASSTNNLPRAHALAMVMRITAFATLIAACLIATCISHDYTLQQNRKVDRSTPNREAIKESTNTIAFHSNRPPNHVLSCPVGFGSSLWSGIIVVCIISFLFHIADSTFFSFFPAILKTKLSFDAQKIGFTFSSFATMSFALSASTVPSTLMQRWNVVHTCTLGLCFIACGLASLAMTTGDSFTFFPGKLLFPRLVYDHLSVIGPLLSGALYFCGVSLFSPTIPFMLLQCVPPQQRGRVMGLDGAINTLARIASPLIMGEVYRLNGASTTFGLSSMAVFTSIVMILQTRRIVT